MKKRGRFDVPATFPLSCPPSVLPGGVLGKNPFPNPVFSFRPPEPLPSQGFGEHGIAHKDKMSQGVKWMWREGTAGTAVPRMTPPTTGSGRRRRRRRELKSVTTPIIPSDTLMLFQEIALRIFGQPAAKPGVVTTPSTGFGAMPASLNFGGFAATTVQPATSIGLFGCRPSVTEPIFGTSASAPFSVFGGTSTAGVIQRMSTS